MEIPQLRMAEKRLLLTVGRYQSEENPKSMSELAEEIGEKMSIMQKGKSTINEDFIEIEKQHPKKILKLSDEGREVYEVLEDYIEVLN